MTKKYITVLLLLTLLLFSCTKTKDNGENSSNTQNNSSENPISTSQSSNTSNNLGDISPPSISEQDYPRIDGSTANIPLLSSLYSLTTGVTIEQAETMTQVSGGTGAVWRNMMYGGSDILIVYEAPENIKDEMKESGFMDEIDITPIARDGLVFLINKNNPVNSLTQQQLIDIYTDKITDWADVGGDQGKISAFQRNLESGSQTLFLRLLMKDIVPVDPPSELRPGGMGALIDAVSAYDGEGGSIGYSVYYYANLMYENPNLKLLAVDDIEPTRETIGNGSYPLTNEVYVVIRKNEPQDSPARILRDWLVSDEGTKLIEQSDYVPIS